MLPDDPIVFPGQPGASHMHDFVGNASTNANSTTQSLFAANKSTCDGGTANLTSYWHPAMKDSAGNFIASTDSMIYYKSGYNQIPKATLKNPPNGLRFVFGELPTNDKPLPNWVRHHSFSCDILPDPTPSDDREQMIPACPAGGVVQLAIQAPNCWDGINLDSPDHRSHMSYSGGGVCDAAHPVALPTITINIHWPVTTNTNGWKLSSDMYGTPPWGYSAHADIWVNWQEDIKETFMTNCVRKGADCHGALLGNIAAYPPYGQMLY
jgi:hypothetical protein